jgi:CheY-like chemotaxis protein
MAETQKTVLVIEDDRDISSTIQSVLSAAGYRVLTANNGQDGRRLIQSQKPDLVLTDMMMPRMGGFPVLEFLAELPDAPFAGCINPAAPPHYPCAPLGSQTFLEQRSAVSCPQQPSTSDLSDTTAYWRFAGPCLTPAK